MKLKWKREWAGSVGEYYALRPSVDPSTDWFTARALARKLDTGEWELCVSRRHLGEDEGYITSHHKLLREAKAVALVTIRLNNAEKD
jgi:hypothetical protein